MQYDPQWLNYYSASGLDVDLTVEPNQANGLSMATLAGYVSTFITRSPLCPSHTFRQF